MQARALMWVSCGADVVVSSAQCADCLRCRVPVQMCAWQATAAAARRSSQRRWNTCAPSAKLELNEGSCFPSRGECREFFLLCEQIA